MHELAEQLDPPPEVLSTSESLRRRAEIEVQILLDRKVELAEMETVVSALHFGKRVESLFADVGEYDWTQKSLYFGGIERGDKMREVMVEVVRELVAAGVRSPYDLPRYRPSTYEQPLPSPQPLQSSATLGAPYDPNQSFEALLREDSPVPLLNRVEETHGEYREVLMWLHRRGWPDLRMNIRAMMMSEGNVHEAEKLLRRTMGDRW